MFGCRPVAISSSVPWMVSSVAPASTTSTRWRSARTRSTFTPLRIVTPSRASASSTTATHSGSSLASGCAAISSTVTSEPSRRNACASSSPLEPAPMTIRCFGRSRASKTFSLVKYGHCVEAGDRRHHGLRAGGDHEAARPDLEPDVFLGPEHHGAGVAEARLALDDAHMQAGEALPANRSARSRR